MRKTIAIIVALLSFFVGVAQSDSLFLKVEKLDTEDIRKESGNIFNTKIVSASRSLQELSDFPFTIYVITKQEIEEKGYNTLVDALKWVPGIRVSQPGSGSEGETFTMRGLHGNTYAKILINGMPVRPYATRGMPIGAQLPIREAERIEVIFGPVAALYGSDAAAGVINIITRQSDRPLYTQANISIGANGYSSIHAVFGGKLGRGNNIFKYNVYGSTTSFDTRDIFQDTSYLYNPDNYDEERHYLESPNYRRNGPGSILPALNETPHLSRLGGADLSFRNLSLSSQRMYRRDHSAIGLNPAAVSYNNPNTFIAETIDNHRLSWDKKWSKVGLRLNAHYLQYKSDKNSSYRYVHNVLNRALSLGAEHTSQTEEELEMKEEAIFDRYFSGARYVYNESKEYRLEFLNNYTPLRFVELVIGGDFHLTRSTIENFLARPYTSRQLEINDNTIDQWIKEEWRSNLFGQAYISFPKLKGIISFNYILSKIYDSGFNPRLGLLYEVTDNLSIRGFYGEALRYPTAFYFGNFYLTNEDKLDRIWVGFNPSDKVLQGIFNNYVLVNPQNLLVPEETSSYELGGRWSPTPQFNIDASVFLSRTKNFISFEPLLEVETPTQEHFIVNGYFNLGDSETNLYGIQGQLQYKTSPVNPLFEASFGFSFTRGTEELPDTSAINEAMARELDFVREQPNFIGQLQIGFLFTEKNKIYVQNNFVSKSYSKSLQTREEFEFTADRFVVDPYYTMDLIWRYRVNENFTSYISISNVFNTEYGGLSATGTPDDLLYNPQSGRLWTMGLSYRLD